MKKFDGILICTDLDGTLLANDKTVSRENREAIAYFKENGGRFTFITGRMPFFVDDVYNAVRPNAPIGCINGGGLYDYEAHRYIMATELPREALELVEYATDRVSSIGFQINTLERIYFCRENATMAHFRECTRVPNLTAGLWDVHEPIAKVVFGAPDPRDIQKIAKVIADHPLSNRYSFVCSEATLCEILPLGVNKASVLPHLASHLGISQSRIIALGDYDNDVAMLQKASLGIAVANATDSAKAAADRVTVSNEEHAVAHIIEELDAGRLKI